MGYHTGAKNLITDIAGLMVGNAQDEQIKSGVTVLTMARPFTCAVHVMGGAPGTRETDLLAPHNTVQQVDALVLSGGSAFGLDAASGVADALAAQGRGFDVGGRIVPIVPSAILFDLLNGGDKDWADNPYRALGKQALGVVSDDFALGSVGAGTGALTARLKGGLGSASLKLPSGITVGALVAANPVGDVIGADGRKFWAAPFEMGTEFGGLGVAESYDIAQQFQTKLDAMKGANTTIAIVATDADLDQASCTRMAMVAHDGMARAIVPSHTPMDGDLVFGLSTGEKPANSTDLLEIGAAAAQCLARAIARGIYHATPHPTDAKPCWRVL